MHEFLYNGELVSEGGLEPVAQALAHCSWPIELRRSGYDGTLYLREASTQPGIDIEMQSGRSNRFLFSGGADGTVEHVLESPGDFSRCLAVGGFAHRVEVYDRAKELVGYFHHRWPQTK
jgi:hypothetical protein